MFGGTYLMEVSMRIPPLCCAALTLVLALSLGATARAETALVAVAANFAGAAETLSPMFTAATGHEVQLTTGSTGKLYAQIGEGAPFQVLLSADAKTPEKLEAEGRAVAGTGFTYAVGQLALYSADPARIGTDAKAALSDPDLRFIAIANPELAPYGVAAREALQAMGLWDEIFAKIVMGQNIGQTHALVDTGAAEVGFVALSAIIAPDTARKGSHWLVPQEMFQPIRQDAVLLVAGQDNPAAVAFLDFLRSPQAVEVMAAYGYGAGE
jgi:molybdate transport system substrate-binding protein